MIGDFADELLRSFMRLLYGYSSYSMENASAKRESIPACSSRTPETRDERGPRSRSARSKSSDQQADGIKLPRVHHASSWRNRTGLAARPCAGRNNGYPTPCTAPLT